MSADNWSICPKCMQKAEAEQTANTKTAEAMYGKVSSAKYAELLALANTAPAEMENSLREDYEIGVNKLGEFYIIYGCSCRECGFEFSFKSEKNILK